MMELWLLWAVRLFLLLLVVATGLPLLRLGFWFVRLCDFPRLQIAALFGVVVAIVVGYASATIWTRELQIYGSIALLLGLWQLAHIAPYTPLWRPEIGVASSGKGASLRLAVVNLKFDNSQRTEAQRALAALDADLMLLIEVDDEWDSVLKAFDTDYPHTMGVVRGQGLGIKIWSRLPLEEQQVRHLVSDDRASLFTSVALDQGENVKFVGVHPTPPGLKASEAEPRHDSRIRDAELVLVAKEIEQDSKAAWIVTGDFNDVAWSHTTRLFKRLSGLVDPRVGRGLYNTYHAEHFLLRYPIDHVLVSSGFHVGQLERVAIPGSDHFAIVTELFPPPLHADGCQPEPCDEEREEAQEIVEEGAEDAAERGDSSEEAKMELR